MKLLFLDIDGVLFTAGGCIHHQVNSDAERAPRHELDPVAMSLLAHLLEKNKDISVVVSSTWRLGHPLAELRDILGPKIGPRVVGVTPALRGGHRGHEIRSFLRMFHVPVESEDIIILDDDRDMNPYMGNLFLTDPYNGFTARDMFKVERYLKSSSLQKKLTRIKRAIWYNISRFYWRYHRTIQWKLQWAVDKLLRRD
jgi:hypothetical protein